MSTALQIRTDDKYVTVDGLKTRYIEDGKGPVLLLLHGAQQLVIVNTPWYPDSEQINRGPEQKSSSH